MHISETSSIGCLAGSQKAAMVEANAHLITVQHGAPDQTLDDILCILWSGIHIFVNCKRASSDVIGNATNPTAVIALVLHPDDVRGRQHN